MRFWLQVLSVIFLSLSASGQIKPAPVAQNVAPAKENANTAPSLPETLEKTEPPLIDQVGQNIKKAGQGVVDKLNETRLRRSVKDYFVLGSYSPLDFILPGKLGATFGVIRNADQTWELEYVRGSVSVPFAIEDLGAMTDERISLIGRSYGGANSFNFSYGITYFAFAVHLGNKFTNALAPNSSADLLRTEAFGFNGAIGNRWTFDRNITIGVDWLSWSQPIFLTKKQNAYSSSTASQQDKDDVDKAMNLISYFLRFAAIKFQIGILF